MDIPANHQQVDPKTGKTTGDDFVTFGPDGFPEPPLPDLKNPDLKARWDEAEAAKVNEAAEAEAAKEAAKAEKAAAKSTPAAPTP